MSDPAPSTSPDNHTRDSDDAARGGPSRRSMLAATAGLTVSMSGCIREVRSIVNRDEVAPLSLTISTVPADGDRESIQLARAVGSALESVGADIAIDMLSQEEFQRAILVNHDFDLYVGPHPGDTTPDFLYELLHSRFAEEAGWQNPFGLTNLAIDDRLDEQRVATGVAADADGNGNGNGNGDEGENGDENETSDREDAITATLETVAREQPFVPICRPTEIRLARSDRFQGWGEGHPATRFGYLGLEPQSDGASAELRAVHTDARPSQNLNPLSAEYRERGLSTELLYDSLAVAQWRGAGDRESETDTATDVSPWLASDWEWSDDDTLLVTLREDCEFHDGTRLTAEDVAFTYEFLADTTRGSRRFAAPAPHYRGRVAAVDDVTDLSETELEFTVAASQPVAERALEVPILPKHIWDERTDQASLRGVTVSEGTTEALVTDNVPAIGSGPYQFDERTDRDHLTLARFDAHFTRRDGVDLPEPTSEHLRIQIDPRSTSAIELVESDSADVTSSPLESYVVDDVFEDDEAISETTVLESPSWSFYHIGFNTRRAPLSNPRFRRVVARLLDKEQLVEEVFHGHAQPIATPVVEEWVPDSLAWNGSDPETPFFGTDGELDVAAARDAFEDAGLRYDDDGRLRVRH
ncbi:ABC-type transport system periplasmic substrate-binding protein (probable substrate dipeptide/oligopeptide) [Natrialba magadii ATCC 43099]|uniref:ABC-type transport system periplasmic substrate-binding protein (Probable substrate dipeptide/oligopeptide) n=1 Tax=Natrialba magadii (strain ATCC 43099 / DSM 3394 / CCM 3739 / CIP 104546 / IAM 13178 / JCM 8861 / NBRC 102185 / NCIMB 2190 / MS3) TaxID=547559 RepID=D3SRX9_NATMM|nr:ABC transporter substrate-binding protein [Natrialba magadii]ADD06753.1 ABC-type transport system periplasmic substrate-binding protein (probable substrate dipeptide/oligopeptide) [Natrialba magadii ATCC 43099]ELY27811.1 family 5 extracellular solute-binding protein [Natrialba magadii ATCC 43099]